MICSFYKHKINYTYNKSGFSTHFCKQDYLIDKFKFGLNNNIALTKFITNDVNNDSIAFDIYLHRWQMYAIIDNRYLFIYFHEDKMTHHILPLQFLPLQLNNLLSKGDIFYWARKLKILDKSNLDYQLLLPHLPLLEKFNLSETNKLVKRLNKLSAFI